MSAAPVGTLPELGLLERSVDYARGTLVAAATTAGDVPTPCAAWTLADLLTHMGSSLRTLEQAAVVGGIAVLEPPAFGPSDLAVAEQVALLQTRACALMESWMGPQAPVIFRVGGSELQAGLLAAAGALEITVHAWDVGRACRLTRPIPRALAEDLLSYAPLLVSDVDRPHRFGPPLPTGTDSSPAQELLALVGRRI
ncbi:maleylpyruvate isomerase family mycothiol-dependent enzyme [Ornithinimicrobium cryptoxanthini]|uniref:maleylpyruvate isomerase family mycothiol-dependent enzyme n=1 Tax=Ornithinimicrobium cryptoxanthini TaxID=2934161 RepID=UPI0021189396|nr:maleylpyruvate isomerase family mycothiol-dependent enzyme [Ornithinimicrobium cryptoxanthini]